MLRVSLANPTIIAFEDLKDQSLNPIYMKNYKKTSCNNYKPKNVEGITQLWSSPKITKMANMVNLETPDCCMN